MNTAQKASVFRETLYHDHGQVLSVNAILHEGRTEYQDVLVFENPTFGRVLVLDGIVQLTELDNHIYHEMLVHVPLMAHGAARDVLVIGGGDGGTLKEVLKHPVETAVLAELDAGVIAISRRYFPAISGGAFDDPRAEVMIGDAADYVSRADRTFDAIIVDSTDPRGPGEVLFSETFYEDCRAALRPGGFIALQSGVPFYQPQLLERSLKRLQACFGAASSFLAPVPTYAHGMLALLVAAAEDKFCPSEETLQQRMTGLGSGMRYYSPAVHRAAFVMVPHFDVAAAPQAVGATA